MFRVQPSKSQRYAVSGLIVGVALGLRVLLAPFQLGVSPLLLLAIAGCAWFGGAWLSLLAAVLLTVIDDRLIMPLSSSEGLSHLSSSVQFSSFVAVALLISTLKTRLQTAQRRSEANLAELKENEKRYRLLVKAIADMVWKTAPDGQVIEMPDWCAFTGQHPSQIKGWGWLDAVHPDDRAQTVQVWSSAVAQRTMYDTEYRVRRADGVYRYFSARAVPVLSEAGDVVEWMGICADITERKQQEAAIKHSEAIARARAEELEIFIEAVPAAIWIAQDPDCHDMTSNRAAHQLMRMPYGLNLTATPADGLYALPFTILQQGQPISPTDLPMQRAAKTGQPVEAELEFVFAPADVRFLYGKAVPLFNETGAVRGVIGAFLDVTEHRQATAALGESQERLNLALEAAKMGSWEWNIETGEVHWSASLERLFGMASGTFDGRYESVTQMIHPDDRAWVTQAIQRAVYERAAYNIEFRFIKPDGTVRWAVGNGRVFYDLQGKPLRMTGVDLDITERKQTEQALRQKQEWLDLTQMAASLGSFEWNFQTNETVWSKELELIYGLGESGFDGTYENWAQRIHPDDLPRIEAEARQALTTGQLLTDYRVVLPDRSIRWVHLRAKVFRDDNGRPLRMAGVNVDMTERKQIEIALKASESRFRRIVESNILGVFFGDLSGRVTEANDAFLQIIGYTQDDLNNGHINWAALTPPDYYEPTQRAVEELKRHGVCAPFEKEFVRKDGSRAFVLIASALFEGANEQGFSCVLDITARKQAEAERDRSELQFRMLADTMPQMFWITRPDGYHEYFNQRWYDYTGTSPEDTTGEGWQTVLHPDDIPYTLDVWRRSLQTGEEYDVEYRFRRAADGEYRWHLGRALPLRENGRIVKWFGSCTDIHDQKLAIEERAQALDRERAARMELEQANRMKDEFLAIVSHELRSPLNPILGWAKLLRTGRLDPTKATQALEIIERNAKLQAELIEDLLDVSRILRGKLSLNLAPVDLVIPISASLETVRLTAEAKAIQINTQLTPQVGLIEGDANRLQQVITNLLTNAIKFTPSGGRVEITLERTDKDVKPHSAEEWQSADPSHPLTSTQSFAQITVSDTGKGIAPDFLPYVFDRFRQADSATTRQFGGLGLGLAIVRSIVELHGGSVNVASAGEGLGATFTVALPLVNSATPAAQPALSVAPIKSLNGLRIVIVDDDVDSLELLRFILEQDGANVQSFSKAQDALDTVFQVTTNAYTRDYPDLLISDIAMPHLDGFMLLRQIRAMSAPFCDLPAIALTAFAGETDYKKIMSVGFQKHLTKPVDPVRLTTTIVELCRR